MLFVYGSLLDDTLMRNILGFSPKGKDATLDNYAEVSFNNFPSIVPQEGSSVYGKTYELEAEDYVKLDEWESRYNRANVETRNGEAQVYVLKERYTK